MHSLTQLRWCVPIPLLILPEEVEQQLQGVDVAALLRVSEDAGELSAFFRAGQCRAGGKKKRGMRPEIMARVLARGEGFGGKTEPNDLTS